MSRISTKQYKCNQCGEVVKQKTNHYGQTWSVGRYNCCPKCPPFRKFPEFGGQTVWDCVSKPRKEDV